MNERIQKLIEQAMETVDVSEKLGMPGTDLVFNKEKFAELIVGECINCLNPLSRNHSMVGAAQDTIREHFGVEE